MAIWEAATGAADPPPSTRPQTRGAPGLEVLVFHPSKHPLHLGQEAPVIVEEGALLPDVGDQRGRWAPAGGPALCPWSHPDSVLCSL